MREILFVAQDCRIIERYIRPSGGGLFTTFCPEETQIEPLSLEISLSLDEIYLRFQFPSTAQ